MKKTLIKIVVFLAVFFASLKFFSTVLNRGNTDLSQDMASASLPVIYMNVNDRYINALHGYTCDMEGCYLRENITPINADRSLNVVIDTYDFKVSKVAYELRSLDGTRLIEDNELESFEYSNNTITAKLSFKDLMEENKEYMLVIKIITGEGNPVKYYARIINTSEIYLEEKIDFVTDFSNKTFTEETAVELKKYMETNKDGDNSSYGHVNIHSNFNQLHWGNLQPLLITEKNINLISIDSSNACIELLYQVQAKNNFYNVREYFRVKRGSDRMYLMEYDRTMNQIIDENDNVIVKGKILNGIVDEDIKLVESKSGSVVSFVQQDSLYSFNTQGGQLTRVFSFRDNKNDDARTRFDANDIKVLSVDENGSSYFVVYGYFTRGIHEGTTGVILYYYDAAVNTIEEQIYIPYTKGYQMLMKDMQYLSYLNTRNQMYVLIDGAVYYINLESRTVETLALDLDENKFVSSKSNRMIAWQTGEDVIEHNSIEYYNLDKMTPTVIQAGAGNIIVPLGFIGEDIVYGTAYIIDITTDSAGRTVIPMYKVTIQSISGETLLEYERENVYITDVEISEEMIVLHRSSRSEDNQYYEVDDDEILNNSVETLTKNTYSSVVTEAMETTYQIVLAKEGSYDSIKVLNPKEVIYEENRTANITHQSSNKKYYVYSGGRLEDICSDPADALILADEMFGEVVNKKGEYVWESGHRKGSFRIETIGDTFIENVVQTVTDPESGEPIEEYTPIKSSTICIEQILKYNEIYKDADTLLTGDSTVLSVLKNNLDADVLNLTGCTLDTVLYYVGQGTPVLAMLNDGNAVLIIGYDSKNVVVYNPLDTEIRKMGLNDSRQYFESNGNRFISYIKD